MFPYVSTRRFLGLGVLFGTVLLASGSPFAEVAWAQDPRIVKQLENSRVRFKTARDWQDRRLALREVFLRGARLWPLPEKTPLNPILHSKREYVGYTVENVALET